MSKKTVQILVEVTLNDSEISISEWEVENTLNSMLHAGMVAEMHDSVKEDVIDNLIHFKTKVVNI